LFEVVNKNLAVADFSGACRTFDGFDRALDVFSVNRSFDLDLWQEVNHVLSTAIQLGMAFLTAEAFDFSDSDTLHPDLGEGLADLVQLKGFDDGGDEFHGCS
jgi:hypothetical protein